MENIPKQVVFADLWPHPTNKQVLITRNSILLDYSSIVRNVGKVLIDLIVLNFAGVVGKQDAEAVQPQVQVCRGSDSPLLPLLHSVVVSAHRNTSVIVLDQLYHKIPRNRKNLLRI